MYDAYRHRDVMALSPYFLFCRGKRLRSGVRLQVHWDVCLPSSQCAGPIRGHRQTDSLEERQQGGECTTHGQLQAQGEHRQEGQAVSGPHGRTQEQKDGLQAEVQVLPRPDSSLRNRWEIQTFFLWPLKTRCCVCFNTNPKGLIELYRNIFIFFRHKTRREVKMSHIIQVISCWRW